MVAASTGHRATHKFPLLFHVYLRHRMIAMAYMLNLSERHLIRLEGGGAHPCARDVAVLVSAMRDELG